MKIIWITWKDKTHPYAGGAEVVTNEICKRLVLNGHEVIMIAGGYGDCLAEEYVDGYKIIRVGSKFSVYVKALQCYRNRLRKWPDLIVEEVNIFPFFTQFYVPKSIKRILFFHQIGRSVWFYQIFFPLSLIGYMIEPIYLWILRNNRVITISKSTRDDLIRYGFVSEKVTIIRQGNNVSPVRESDLQNKYVTYTLLTIGEIRPMKRTLHTLIAFEIVKKHIPNLQLIVAGGVNTRYGQKFLHRAEKSIYAKDIHIHGRVSHDKKVELMQKSHIVTMTSVREGWGLVVTESNSMGTPAIVYNVEGLCDSVRSADTGIICEKNNPVCLARAIIVLLNDDLQYRRIQSNAWKNSKKYTFDNCYEDFINAI